MYLMPYMYLCAYTRAQGGGDSGGHSATSCADADAAGPQRAQLAETRADSSCVQARVGVAVCVCV